LLILPAIFFSENPDFRFQSKMRVRAVSILKDEIQAWKSWYPAYSEVVHFFTTALDY